MGRVIDEVVFWSSWWALKAWKALEERAERAAEEALNGKQR